MRSPIVIALLHPLNLVMLGLVTLAGLISAWWLFPLGLGLWMVMIHTIHMDHALRQAPNESIGGEPDRPVQNQGHGELGSSPPRV